MITGYSNIISVTTLPAPLLLDLYPSAAAAYSLRKLRTDYAGSAIRVRRSSDNTEQDIGFYGNILDTSSLSSFCSGTDGFVTTWYDQSGNARNATQTTAVLQPKIVSSGSVILNNGKPAINFGSFLEALGTSFALNRPYSIYSQFLQTSSSNSRMISSNSNNCLISATRASATVFTEGAVRSGSYASVNQNVIISLIESTSTSKFYYNNTDITNGTGNNDWGTFNIGSSINYAEASFGIMKECIVYNIDKTSDNTAINNNINSYYGIY